VVIPLKVKHRNGRPRVVPPDNIDAVERHAQEPSPAARHCPRLELAASAGTRRFLCKVRLGHFKI
jgi:hypothetical protein